MEQISQGNFLLDRLFKQLDTIDEQAYKAYITSEVLLFAEDLVISIQLDVKLFDEILKYGLVRSQALVLFDDHLVDGL